MANATPTCAASCPMPEMWNAILPWRCKSQQRSSSLRVRSMMVNISTSSSFVGAAVVCASVGVTTSIDVLLRGGVELRLDVGCAVGRDWVNVRLAVVFIGLQMEYTAGQWECR